MHEHTCGISDSYQIRALGGAEGRPGRKAPRTSAIVGWSWVCAGFLAAGASGAEISMVPVSASGAHTIVGNEITLQGAGQRVTFDILAAGWNPAMAGNPRLKAWQVSLDPTGYSSGITGQLTPALESCSGVCAGGVNNGLTCIADGDCNTCVGGANDGLACVDAAGCPGGTCEGTCDLAGGNATCRGAFGGACGGFTTTPGAACATDADCPDVVPPTLVGICEGSECVFPTGVGGFCEPGFILANRGDYVFLTVPDLPVVDLSTPAYRYASASQTDPVDDDGTIRYLGTLVLDVPADARGTFEIGFKPIPETLLQDQSNNFILPLVLTSAMVKIACGSDADCDDSNLCTNDVCTVDQVCSNTPNFDAATLCCDPATGLTTVIDDANDCTVDQCDPSTGSVSHPFAPAGAACGDPTDTTCDGRDTCDGMGTCESNIAPAGSACGDGSASECDAPDSCDGAGACDPNFLPSTMPCGDPSLTDCTAPDQCDGAGVCRPNDVPDGTICDDGAFCTVGETCTAGLCGGGAARDCNDGLACTTDVCDESVGTCLNDLTPGACLIDGICRGDAETNPANDCEECNAGLSTLNWSPKAAGSLCDDGDACTGTGRPGIGFDECDGAGLCTGVVDPDCNDDCAFAVAVTEGVNTGNNDNRAADDAEASCQPDSNNDVWFVYTASCDGTVFASTTGSLFGPSNDPVLSVWDGCPTAGGVEIACDDDSGVALQAALTFTATAGARYWFRVAGFEINTGDIVLNISTVDDCLIAGVCYAANTLNPDNACEACIPEVSTNSWSPVVEGTACGDPSDTDCDSPDACDGAGRCEANPKPDDTVCADEGNECTFDVCRAGECVHPPVPVDSPCGDGMDSECDHPDTCDGLGTCLSNFEPLDTPCGVPDDSQCDHPDICDGAGSCDSNLEPDGTPCDDTDICTGTDICQGGLCAGTPIPEAPIVDAIGPRYLLVTPQPAGTPAPVALQVTSPAWPCLLKFVSSSGRLVTTPTFKLPDDWGTIAVFGHDIVPSTPYDVRAECGTFLSPPGSDVTALWGDVVGPFTGGAWTRPDGTVDVFDTLAIVEGFENQPTAPAIEQIDLWPCTPDGVIDIFDIVQVVDAFRGLPYPCAEPCATE